MHFKEFDFYDESQDSNLQRPSRLQPLKLSLLKKGSVPSIFPNVPSYLSSPPPDPRSSSATSSARCESEATRVEEEATAFLQADEVTTLDDLLKKLDRSCLPGGIFEFDQDNEHYFMAFSNDSLSGPTISFSLILNQNLELTLFSRGIKVPMEQIAHLTGLKTTVDCCSQVLNLLSFLKVYTESKLPENDAIQYCIALLDLIIEDSSAAEDCQQKLVFIREQLDLATHTPRRRRYSSLLLATAVMWDNVSPSLYRQMVAEDLLTLPSEKYVRRLGGITLETGLPQATTEYLKTRISSLSEMERICSIIIDEVYSAKRIEYMNGQFYGLENSQVTKTLLCFMVKSLSGKYEDVVAMVPLATLTSEIIFKWWDKVLKTVTEIGFDIAATLTDAHSSNRRFFAKDLCKGKMATYVLNPYNKSSKIFLVFDSVHIFKNFYNNFLNRRFFSCPAFEEEEISAKYEHVEQLYKLEMGHSVKYAHKLSDKVIAPQPIERTKVQLADRFFDDSTIAGLEHLGQDDWKETARFLKLIRRFWNCVNVQSQFSSTHKRDDRRKAVTLEDGSQKNFLVKFLSWLEEWEKKSPKTGGFSRETFLAAKQTTSALIELADYLLTEKNFVYVLLGKVNSDPLERRFGWYRQLAGANYFISVRQFLEAEKKIRLRFLVRYENLTLADVSEVFQDSAHITQSMIESDTGTLLACLTSETLNTDCQLDGEEGVVYYIAGYIARSMLKKLKCQVCPSLLVKSLASPDLEMAEDEDTAEEEKSAKEAFINSVNRGGLVTPSELIYIVCVHAVQLKKEIFDGSDVQELFLSFGSPRSVFVKTLTKQINSTPESAAIFNKSCDESHDFMSFVPTIATRFFNCMSKNFISSVNDSIHASRKRAAKPASKESASGRKINKLQSC